MATDRARQLEALDAMMGHIQNNGIPPLLRIMMIHEITNKVMKDVADDLKQTSAYLAGVKKSVVGDETDVNAVDKYIRSNP